jgi:tetratricopeptide (TPR) repeat protein
VARSSYVNRQVRLFRSRHPDRPVIPLIVEGTPDDPDHECIPPALRSLRFAAALDGTESCTDEVTPDLRDKGDGFELAIAKVVARMIGLSPHDLYRRSERERHRQGRIRAAVAAVAAAAIAMFAIAGAFYGQAYQQKATLAEVAALVDTYSLTNPTPAAVPGARDSLTQAITVIAEGAATDRRYAKARELLKIGRIAEAEPLLNAVAQDKAKRDAKEAAAAYRNLGSIAAVSDPRRAREHYAEAARLDPLDIEGMYRNGWYQMAAGQRDLAEASYRRVVAAAKASNDAWVLWAQFGLGDIARHRGHLDDALATFRVAGAIAENRAKADPGNTGRQHDFAIGNERIGDVLMAQGHPAQSLQFHQARLEVISRLMKGDPRNARWQRELAVSDNKVGDVLAALDRLPEALASYQAGLAIMDDLANADPRDAGRQRDVAASHDRIGDLLMAQDRLPEAQTSYQASFAIVDRLVEGDPGNAGWQHDLAVSYGKIGDVLAAQGNLSEALTSYQANLTAAARLAKVEPDNTRWQRERSATYGKVGDLLAEQGRPTDALKFYQASLAIADRLTRADPGDARWQRELSVTYSKAGDLLADRNPAEALKSHRASLAIMERLTKADPGNARSQRVLSVTYSKIGDLLARQGDLPEAL